MRVPTPEPKPVTRHNKLVGIRLYPDDEARLRRLVDAEPDADGEVSRYVRILLGEEEARKFPDPK